MRPYMYGRERAHHGKVGREARQLGKDRNGEERRDARPENHLTRQRRVLDGHASHEAHHVQEKELRHGGIDSWLFIHSIVLVTSPMRVTPPAFAATTTMAPKSLLSSSFGISLRNSDIMTMVTVRLLFGIADKEEGEETR